MQPEIEPTRGGRKKQIVIWSAIGGILLLAVVLVASAYSGLLGARFAPGLAFDITGPNQIVAGQTAIVTWDTSPENQAQYPSDKIEFCRGRLFGERCVTLNQDTTNDGEALVFVPQISPGSGYLRLTARNRPGGDLLPSISMTRPIEVIGDNGATQHSTVKPANVGGGSIATITAAGPRLRVAQQSTYTVVLPEPSLTKKVEICQHGNRCYTLASSATGSSTQARIPNVPPGRAFLKVSERDASGILTGHEFFRRALLVVAADPNNNVPVEEVPDEDEESPDDDNEAPQPRPEPAQPRAQFIVPVNNEQAVSGNDLDIRVQLSETTEDHLTCQQWKLNGEILTTNDWVSSQSPDLSAEACN